MQQGAGCSRFDGHTAVIKAASEQRKATAQRGSMDRWIDELWLVAEHMIFLSALSSAASRTVLVVCKHMLQATLQARWRRENAPQEALRGGDRRLGHRLGAAQADEHLRAIQRGADGRHGQPLHPGHVGRDPEAGDRRRQRDRVRDDDLKTSTVLMSTVQLRGEQLCCCTHAALPSRPLSPPARLCTRWPP